MRKSRAAVVGTVGTVMIGAGWAAGLISTAASADASGISLVADATTDTAAGSSTTSPSATANPTPTASASPSETTAPSDAASASSSAPADTSTSTPPQTTPAAPAGVTGTYTGATVQTRYGNYQVQLTISDSVITDLTLLQDGATDGESRAIKANAIPTLTSRVLSAQTYNVSGVSGASYTSQGMLLSVKSAMQSAGLA